MNYGFNPSIIGSYAYLGYKELMGKQVLIAVTSNSTSSYFARIVFSSGSIYKDLAYDAGYSFSI